MKIIKYDNLNIIADKLIGEILSNCNPFDTYNIILPNLILEQWFKAYWLKKTNRVLLNVKFTRLTPFINEVYNNEIPLMTSDKMSLFIADILLNNKSLFSDISSYYDNNYTNLYDLSCNLAKLFNKYENDLFIPDGWQKVLLDRLHEISNYTFLSDTINNPIVIDNKSFIIGFTKLDKIHLKALVKLSNLTVYFQNEAVIKPEMLTCSVSSKEREIEFIHDEICMLLEGNTMLYDITVYAPHASEYEGVIKKVFSTGGDKNFPDVPYVITNNNRDLSNTGEAIELLYNVLASDEFTRNDFYRLISNPNIEKSRNIDPSKINDIISALDSMNVYRNNKKCDEWLYGIKRLLLAKLIGKSYIDNYVNLDGDIYLPFGNISMDDSTISIVCDIVNDIEEFRNNKDYSIDNIKLMLNKWLSYSKNLEFEENYYYNKALNVLDFLKENNLDLPKDIIFKALIDSTKNISVTSSNIITGGVTFIDFNPKNIISSKYIFLLGMSINNLPRSDKADELDERTDKESITLEDYNTFRLICNNADRVYCSYVNIDLKTLQEYKPSLLLGIDKPDLSLGLIEDRDYSSLYSKSEFNKKSYGINLTKDIVKRDKEHSLFEMPKIISYKDLADFINEGLSAKIKRLITKYDNSLENSSKEYEPLKTSGLTKYKIKYDLFLKMLDERTNELESDTIDEILNKYKITHDLAYLDNNSESIIKEVSDYYSDITENFIVYKPFTLDLVNNSISFSIEIKDSYIVAGDDGFYNFYGINPKKLKDPSDYTKIYIISLAHIVHEGIGHAKVRLNNNKDFEVSLEQAKDILNKLYIKYNDYSINYLSPIDTYKYDENQYDEVINKAKLIWKNFNDSNMIKIRDNAGFTRVSFKDFWPQYKEEIEKLVLFKIEEEKND